MNILILGNGFDLAHGLPTRYTDFLRFCKDFLENAKSEENNGKIYFGDINLHKEFLSLAEYNIWLEYFMDITPLDEEKNFTWVDFEREIKNVVMELEHMFESDKDSISCYEKNSHFLYKFLFISIDNKIKNEKICDRQKIFCTRRLDPPTPPHSKDRLLNAIANITPPNSKARILNSIAHISFKSNEKSKIVEIIYDDLREFTRLFEIYCALQANYDPLITGSGKLLREDKFKDGDIYVLTFNYTFTYEMAYQKVYTDDYYDKSVFTKSKGNCCHIHGFAHGHTFEHDDTDLVFGIDEYLKDGKEDTEFEFVLFKKYFQRIMYHANSEYKEWIKKLNVNYNPEEKHYIHIIGHSLDLTDGDVLREFFNCIEINPTVYIRVYYYEPEKNKYADKIDKIQKVIKLITQEKLVKYSYGPNAQIKFINQNDPYEGIFNSYKIL